MELSDPISQGVTTRVSLEDEPTYDGYKEQTARRYGQPLNTVVASSSIVFDDDLDDEMPSLEADNERSRLIMAPEETEMFEVRRNRIPESSDNILSTSGDKIWSTSGNDQVFLVSVVAVMALVVLISLATTVYLQMRLRRR
jgi:hypothetical protein